MSPDFVLETHTKQDIDPDGYYLWKLAFGSFDEDQTIENIVDKMLMPRFKGVLANALEVGSCFYFFFKRIICMILSVTL